MGIRTTTVRIHLTDDPHATNETSERVAAVAVRGHDRRVVDRVISDRLMKTHSVAHGSQHVRRLSVSDVDMKSDPGPADQNVVLPIAVDVEENRLVRLNLARGRNPGVENLHWI